MANQESNIDTDYLSNSELEELGLEVEEICVAQLEEDEAFEDAKSFYTGESCRG